MRWVGLAVGLVVCGACEGQPPEVREGAHGVWRGRCELTEEAAYQRGALTKDLYFGADVVLDDAGAGLEGFAVVAYVYETSKWVEREALGFEVTVV